MKRLLLLALSVSLAFAQSGAKTVYVLSMSGGMDQYLAERLTSDHVLQVVADPKLADLILTDSLGENFEHKMDTIRPREGDDTDAQDVRPVFHSNAAKGTIFLVDAKSRHIVWSDYQKAPRTHSSGDMSRAAGRIAKKMHETYAK